MCLQGVRAQHFLVFEQYAILRHALHICLSKSIKTKEHIGWKLVYYEAYVSESDARERERKLKQYGAGRGHLKKRIDKSIEQMLKSAG